MVNATWTDDDDILLRKLVAAGNSAGQIALEFQFRSRNSIIGRCHRLGLSIGNGVNGNAQLERPSMWNGKLYDELERLYFSAKGFSRPELAEELGIDMRQLHQGIKTLRRRHGLADRSKPLGGNKGSETRRMARNAVAVAARELNPKASPILPDEENASAVTIMALEAHHCRWIAGKVNASETRYCGERKLDGAAYCARHWLRAHQV